MENKIFISLSPEELSTLIREAVKAEVSQIKPSGSQPDADELLTTKQAASFIKLHITTIYGLISRDEIPYSKQCGRLYFSKKRLTEWITSGRPLNQ